MRLAGSNGEVTEKAIRRAAVQVIARHGFEAASLRLIAKEVGIQAPSLYNYIKSKEQLLFELLREPLVTMIAEFQEGAQDRPDPYDRLLIFIGVHLNFHLDFTTEVFIGNMELRHLTRPHYKIVSGLRDQYSKMLTAIVEDGAKAGRFKVEDARVMTFALIAMLSGVCNWYRPDGPRGKDELIQIHTRLALQMLGVDGGAPAAAPGRAAAKPRKRAAAAATA
jgi:AcrR family transcriptional regulator